MEKQRRRRGVWYIRRIDLPTCLTPREVTETKQQPNQTNLYFFQPRTFDTSFHYSVRTNQRAVLSSVSIFSYVIYTGMGWDGWWGCDAFVDFVFRGDGPWEREGIYGGDKGGVGRKNDRRKGCKGDEDASRLASRDEI